jgi:hypothetical protein
VSRSLCRPLCLGGVALTEHLLQGLLELVKALEPPLFPSRVPKRCPLPTTRPQMLSRPLLQHVLDGSLYPLLYAGVHLYPGQLPRLLPVHPVSSSGSLPCSFTQL